jgi:hypothetical protein
MRVTSAAQSPGLLPFAARGIEPEHAEAASRHRAARVEIGEPPRAERLVGIEPDDIIDRRIDARQRRQRRRDIRRRFVLVHDGWCDRLALHSALRSGSLVPRRPECRLGPRRRRTRRHGWRPLLPLLAHAVAKPAPQPPFLKPVERDDAHDDSDADDEQAELEIAHAEDLVRTTPIGEQGLRSSGATFRRRQVLTCERTRAWAARAGTAPPGADSCSRSIPASIDISIEMYEASSRTCGCAGGQARAEGKRYPYAAASSVSFIASSMSTATTRETPGSCIVMPRS